MNKTHQAAMWVHEVIWKLTQTRSLQETTLATKRIVALLFAENIDLEILRSLLIRFVVPEPEQAKLFTVWDNKIDMTDRLTSIQVGRYVDGYGCIQLIDNQSPSTNCLKSVEASSIKPGDYFLINQASGFWYAKNYTSQDIIEIIKNLDPNQENLAGGIRKF